MFLGYQTSICRQRLDLFLKHGVGRQHGLKDPQTGWISFGWGGDRECPKTLKAANLLNLPGVSVSTKMKKKKTPTITTDILSMIIENSDY